MGTILCDTSKHQQQQPTDLWAQLQQKLPTIKVIVIGAGISGLSVAYHLKKLSEMEQETETKATGTSTKKHQRRHLLEVEFLEARDRIGGRVEPFLLDSDKKKGVETWVDLGGQWVHQSSPKNPIRRLMEDELNLSFVGDDKVNRKKQVTKATNRFQQRKLTNVLFDQDGNPVSKAIVQRAKRMFYKAMGDWKTEGGGDRNNDVLDDQGNLSAHVSPNRINISFKDFIDARVKLELQATTKDDKNMGRDSKKCTTQQLISVMNYLVHRSEENEGGNLREVSALLAQNLYDWQETVGEGPDRVIKGSYKSLLDALACKLNLDINKPYSPEAAATPRTFTSGPKIAETTPTSVSSESHGHQIGLCRVRLRPNVRVGQINYDNGNGNKRNGRTEKMISLAVVETDNNENNNATIVPDCTCCSNSNNTIDGLEPNKTTSPDKHTTTVQKILECDYCVCTVPLGVLQQGSIKFVPPLPPKRQEAIDGIGMGLLNKIVFRFDFATADRQVPFWGDLKQFGICHEDPSMIKTYYDCTEDYYDNNDEIDSCGDTKKHRTTSAVLVQFLAGASADRVDPPLPLRKDREDDAMPLIETKESGLTDEEVIKESLEALRSVFGSNTVPDPVVSKITRWRKDPWSCGSYSFAKIGSSPNMYDEIASPLGGERSNSCSDNRSNKNNYNSKDHGRLLFAGEHTSKYYHSTVHGAWETGQREAERIFKQITNTE